MIKLISAIGASAMIVLLAHSACAEEAPSQPAALHKEGTTPHYPLRHPKEQDWSFAGFTGHYDKQQLQRGLKVYTEVCSACHSMRMVAYRSLADLGYSDEQVKAFAADHEVQDGPDANGDMYTRKAVPSDYFPSPFANAEAAAASNNGAAPPDFSLIAKARGITRGFPQFVFDMLPGVGGYQEGGPDYIYSLLTGYDETPPAGLEIAEGTNYNPYFGHSAALAMPKPISDDQVTYEDGSPQTVDQYARDVSAFLMWAAEPHLEERKRTGFMVMVFLIIFSGLVYLTKRSVYSGKN
ncbi:MULTISPECIES: cytochrome c1 [unclassified Rhizobium]|uniref:cytochrome c1 n=1 Tax=unclassified Rhizobium TaxID=2613769 RepID=UPI001AD9B54E|nr:MULTISPECIES: cytochrome c1 [unclassified Rhizobium]MBO9126991.1 cytochrome c1 [Rhizobium sp. 16-488-2b]MBO9177438.1 cytochrome c1 [Rhizobium sp. 16-488-2a]